MFSIVPIRMEDRYLIMKWRNEQIYHLRQNKPLTKEEQDNYFSTVVKSLFDKEKPEQILFSYLEGEKCIGYGGLVHINWVDKNAEISFVINTELEKDFFHKHWVTYLSLIEQVAFEELGFKKIYTYAFNLRAKLYIALESCGFKLEQRLINHVDIDGVMTDVLIHSKTADYYLRYATVDDTDITYKWASDETIRKYAFNKQKIEFKDHSIWFKNKISDINCNYFILCDKNGKCMGSIRFDLNESGEAMISYLIDPEFHGKGLGSVILKLGIQQIRWNKPDVKIVYGLVQPENTVSVKIFERLGFNMSAKDSGSIRFDKIL